MAEEVKPLPCVACGFQAAPAMPGAEDDVARQPYEATMFTTHGHYGSTVFDPMGDGLLEIVVCDNCIRAAARMNRVALVKVTQRTTYSYQAFRPDSD